MQIGCKIFSRWGQFTCPEIQSALPLPRPPLYNASNHKLMIMVRMYTVLYRGKILKEKNMHRPQVCKHGNGGHGVHINAAHNILYIYSFGS